MKAVRFDEYGGVDVLNVQDVPTPEPGPGQVMVQVKAAGINPGEGKIRSGALHSRFPATFPSGEGSDLAGIVARTGPGVTGFSVGDEVIGYTDNRASHAEYVIVEAGNLTPRPAGVPWDVAGRFLSSARLPTLPSGPSQRLRATPSSWQAPPAASARSRSSWRG